MIKNDFLKNCLEKDYFKDHQRVLVAVSGGLDSMFLLECLLEFQKELKIELAIAHVNHKQRIESDQEEIEIKKIAEELGVTCFTSSFSGVFSENTARQFRYHFFEHIMEENDYTCLVTAHHADDQVETIFMRFLRGTRLRFFAGIKEKQPFAKGELIRPLLSFSKTDFPKIKHFQDQSNLENHYQRNRVRNLYLPELEKENPRLKEGILDLSQQVVNLYQALDEVSKDIEISDLSVFLGFSRATQSVLLEKYCSTFPDLQLSKEQFAEVLHILNEKRTYHHPLKSGYELYKTSKRFEIRKISPQADSQERSVLLKYDQETYYKGYHFSFARELRGSGVEVYHVSRETPILLRMRQPKDQILHKGMTKKLRRYFINEKIPQKRRDEAVIVEQDGRILGIAGMVTSDLSKFPKSDIMNSKLYIQRNR